MSDQPSVLVCTRLSDMPTPHVKSWRGRCGLCGAHVWVAESSPPFDHLLCQQCAAKEMDDDGGFEPLTEDQVEDVLDYLRRKGVS